MIERFDGLIDEQRYRSATELLDNMTTAEIETSWRLRYRRAWAGLMSGALSAPEALMAFEDLAGADDAHDEEAPRPYSWLIRCLTDMRLEDDARRAADTALGAHPRSGHVLSSIADMHLAFDDRPEARRWHERSLATDPDFVHGRLAYSNLLFIVGQFSEALEFLSPDDCSKDMLASSASLRAAIHDAMGNPDAVVESLTIAMGLVPHSDLNEGRRLLRAGAYATLGDYAAAHDDLVEVWRNGHYQPAREYARRRLDHLAAAAEDAPRRQLAAFPSVHQKWDYCGPAVLELCLQYNGIELSQDEIADVVKRTHGTPMFEIARYLAAHGIEARRIEATPDALRAAIDIGLPVIVQEEYSNSSHVAVIIGYDGRLGVLVAADPATHARISKSFEFTTDSGDIFGNGGILILGRAGTAELEANRRAADAANLKDEEHFRLVDAADERHRDVSGELGNTLHHRIIELCDQALKVAPDFKLAHARRTGALYDLYANRGDQGPVTAALRDIRTRYPRERFSHRIHGAWLMQQGRHTEALVEYATIREFDDNDALAAAYSALIHSINGDAVEAERSGLDALGISPAMIFACENLTSLYVGELAHRAADGLLDTPVAEDVMTALMPTAETGSRLTHHSLAEVWRRAEHFSRLAIAGGPENPFNFETAGILALFDGRGEDAGDSFDRALAIDGTSYRALVGRAAAHEMCNEFDEAHNLWNRMLEFVWGHPPAYLSAARALDRMGRGAAGIELMVRGVALCPEDNGELLTAIYDSAAKSVGTNEAAELLARIAEGKSPELARQIADALDQRGRSAAALRLRRRAVAEAPESLDAKYDLARRLGRASRFREEAEQLLVELLDADHGHHGFRVELAKVYAQEDPVRAAVALEPISDSNSYAAIAIAVLRTGGAGPGLGEVIRARVHNWDSDADGYLHLIDFFRWFDPARAAIVADLVPSDLLDESPDLETQWMAAQREVGSGDKVIARIDAGNVITPENAFSVFWAADGLDDERAASAARILAEHESRAAAEWEARVAVIAARRGDTSAFDDLPSLCGTAATAWTICAEDLLLQGRLVEAQRAIDRAIELDPEITLVLGGAESVATARGRIEESWRLSEKLWEQHPLEHQGAERLALLHALCGDPREAVGYSETAIADGHYCHVAWAARAAALFVGGEHPGAADAARRSMALRPPDERKPDVAELVDLALNRRPDELETRLALLAEKADMAAYGRLIPALRDAAEPPSLFQRLRRD